ncbi:winged helix-turn-helix transcriptional regulator [Candidatus Woesearchaeota archaeon]|nr:winged helix-turn-helix transcriptional regulator [Candidatus Woesearchaeota archaeon]
MRFRKLTIIQARRPEGGDVNEQLQWFGGSLGLFNPRDKDKSCFRIFITLLKSSKEKQEVSSDELAEMTGLTRGTIVHHLNRLMASGMVESYKSKYVLRVDTLETLIAKLEQDLDETLEALKDVAGELDKQLGL